MTRNDTAQTTEQTTEQTTQETTQETNSNYLGKFYCTAYCSCSACCGEYSSNRPLDENGNAIVYGASGAVLKAYESIAVDPAVIPYGTVVIIEGQEYIAQDCGGAVKGYMIDFYTGNNHEFARQFVWNGQYKDVYIKK